MSTPTTDYDAFSPDELKAEAASRGLQVAGTGANGNVIKADLVAALEADDRPDVPDVTDQDPAQDQATPATIDDGDGPGLQLLVTCSGVSYRPDGNPANVALAVHHQVITVTDEAEATRLVMLNAVRVASDEEVALAAELAAQRDAVNAADASGPHGNPYGGRALQSLEDHAREEIERAKADAARRAAKA